MLLTSGVSMDRELVYEATPRPGGNNIEAFADGT
jgi:hypothetical protein